VSAISDPSVGAWLDAFARCVRERDFIGGRVLFAPDVSGFGTVAGHYDGLDALVDHQWSVVWPRTTGFAFDQVTAHWWDARLCAVATTWHSIAVDGGRTRSGRATLVLRRTEDGLVCVHTHFSMAPGTSA
jgi:ketosteroid isomerase-like protein